MARINTNVASLTAQRGLAKSQKTMADTLRRLSSGLRINRGADDPAGLIASETLRSEISGDTQAMDISQANSGTPPTIPVDINVITSARTAELQFAGSSVANSVTLEIAGTDGVEVLTFTSGTTASAMAFAVNRISDATGVS